MTLTTDFGTRDGYVAAMKGVILGLAPGASVVDVSHDVAPGDVRGGAFVLAQAAPYFPAGTVHVAVVDPGVGGAREAVVLDGGAHRFVGPNNGVLALAAPAPRRAHEIAAPSFRRAEVSATFHGRDLFAPAAARLAAGAEVAEAGPPLPLERLVTLPAARAEVVHVDRFGNAITSLGAGEADAVEVAGLRLPVRRTYGDVEPGAPLAYIGSSGYIEIAVRDGNAAERLGLARGTAVTGRKA